MQQVEFSLWPTNKLKIGVVKLQNQKSLNSLTLEMVTSIASKLGEWERDAQVAAVIIYADLMKAFCAGGDVKTVVLELQKNDPTSYSAKFFETEYKMDYMIQTYSKPILVWGNGIVMGGGMGIFCGASHGIVTESTVMAMPEISIGFFPDVGAGYFLTQLPEGIGTFLAWTAARLSADDAVFLKLAHAKISHRKRTEVFKLMRNIDWLEDGESNKKLLSEKLRIHTETPIEAKVKKFIPELQNIFVKNSPQEAAKEFAGASFSDPWLIEAQKTYASGSPLSALVSFEQLRRAKQMSKLDIFLMEWSIARHMADRHDFREGVRARLIDKDNKPAWKHQSTDQVEQREVLAHFNGYSGIEETRASFLKR